MRKKLLFIVNVDWAFISHRLPIALAAQQHGYEIHLACKITNKKEELSEYGFILHDIPVSRSGTSIFGEINVFFKIWRVIRKIKPEVLHLVTIKPVIYGGLASRYLKNVKKIAAIPGLGYVFIAKGLKAKLFRFLVKILYRLSIRSSFASVIFQNPTDRKLFIKYNLIKKEQAILIKGSGVFLHNYLFVEEQKGIPVVMFVGRLLVDKGVREFVEAARILYDKKIACRMVLVGDFDDNPKSISKKEVERWVADGYIEYWGYCSEINNTIKAANIVVLPSYREGLPKALIEAAACGRAVVTTDVPGCRDAIIPGKTGILVPVCNANALSEAIGKLCLNTSLRKNMGGEGRKFAEAEFDINHVISKHLRLYGDLRTSKTSMKFSHIERDLTK
ncbi:glycosyltransferase family 4 protein [Endozoicomonas sp. YOMI1]|uniref:glycosyltransferase family 4 protein n=1 Tax=Endozoicomonas sp. YOMI1 TaxID=2828739 RepID=UPI002149931F|nr:glycosyltransferase family 4 protein [Endozoicomonas sp. YOMI1]